MTATFAASEFNLREDWDARQQRLTAKHDVLNVVDGTAFLMAVTLLASYERHLKSATTYVSCKRADVLRLELPDFKYLQGRIEAGFKRAAELLAEEKIFDAKSLPYATQLIPLACICACLADRITHHGVKQRLLRWYWCGVFGELYGGANETRFAMDLPDVVQWIEGGAEPRTVRDASFAPTRLLSLQSRLAAAYKGLAALLMKHGSRDFVSGTPIDSIPTSIMRLIFTISSRGLGARPTSSLVTSGTALSTRRRCPQAPIGSSALGLIEGSTGKAVSGRESEETAKAFGGAIS